MAEDIISFSKENEASNILSNNKFVTIRVYDTLIGASLTKTLLDSENILTNIIDGGLISADPLLSNALGGIKLQVLNKDTEKALSILEHHDSIKYCLRCNEIMPNHEKCDSCGYIPEAPEEDAPWSNGMMFFLLLSALVPFLGFFWGVIGLFEEEKREQGVIILILSLIVTIFFLYNY